MVDVPFAAVVLLDDQPTVVELSGGDGATSADLATSAATIAVGARDAAQAAAELSVGAAEEASEDADAAHIDRIAADADAAGAEAALAGILAAVDGVSLTTATLNAANRTLLAALDHTLGLPAWLTEGYRSGLFVPDLSDLTTEVGDDPEQGIYVPFSSDPTGGDGAWRRLVIWPRTPEMYGAEGDGAFNDTDAFAALATHIEAHGGGEVALRGGAVYIVGKQDFVNDGTFMWKGRPIFVMDGLTLPFSMSGHGAKFVFADNLKVGNFDAAGDADDPGVAGEICSPCAVAVISITNCTARIHLENIEVDGNEGSLNWGGGDFELVGGDGLYLQNNTAGETVIEVSCHHMPRDGHQVRGIDGTDLSSPKSNSVFIGCNCEYNHRQGMSFTGGRGYTFTACKYNHSGKGTIGHFAAPANGVDLEQETGAIIDLDFNQCEFIDNVGVGFLCVNDVRRINLNLCRIIGTTASAAWFYPARYLVCNDCLIAGGALTLGAIGSISTFKQSELNRFNRCTFTDDVTITPVGTLSGNPIDNLGNTQDGVIYDQCHFRAGYAAGTGLGTHGGDFHDCSFDFGDQAILFGGPHLKGLTQITVVSGGTNQTLNTGVATGKFGASISYNGTDVRRGSKTWDPASLTNGTRATTTVNVPWARKRDRVSVTFSNSLQGLNLWGYVSTEATDTATGAGVVTVVLENNSGGTVDLASGTLAASVCDPEVS